MFKILGLCSKLAENFPQPDVTIHTPIESPSQVDQKYVVIENIHCVFRPKKPKNSVKIHIFKGRFEK
jgi:hypothetical protein